LSKSNKTKPESLPIKCKVKPKLRWNKYFHCSTVFLSGIKTINIQFVTNKNAHNYVPGLNLKDQPLQISQTPDHKLGTINIFILVSQNQMHSQTTRTLNMKA